MLCVLNMPLKVIVCVGGSNRGNLRVDDPALDMLVPDGLHKHECNEWYNTTIAVRQLKKWSEIFVIIIVIRHCKKKTKITQNRLWPHTVCTILLRKA